MKNDKTIDINENWYLNKKYQSTLELLSFISISQKNIT